MEVRLAFKADGPVLAQYVDCEDRVAMIRGPLGSGKTGASCYKVMRFMLRQTANRDGLRRSRWYAVRNTYSDLLGTTWKDWMDLFAPLGRAVKGNMEPPTHYLDFDLQDGTRVKAELIFLALDRPDDVKKLRGAQATGFWLNEVKELDQAIVHMADLRHGRYPPASQEGCRWHGMIGDYNSPDVDHWLYKIAEENQEAGWKFFHQPGGLIKTDKRGPNGLPIYKPNPEAENLKNLPDDYYTQGMKNKPEDWIDVNLCNQYGIVIDGKPVHAWYVDSVHTAPEVIAPNKDWPIVLGFDFGRTPACAMMQTDPRFGRHIFIDEFYADDMGAERFGKLLAEYLNRTYTAKGYKFAMGWGDPSGDNKGQANDATPFTMLRAAGIQAAPTQTNKTAIRRASLSNPGTRLCMDGRPALIVSPKCARLRKGLMGGFCYRRIMVTGERYTDEPDKNLFSHICEAAEYAAQGAGEGVRSIAPVDVVTRPIVVVNDWSPFDA